VPYTLKEDRMKFPILFSFHDRLTEAFSDGIIAVIKGGCDRLVLLVVIKPIGRIHFVAEV
jgi:hypothetical protein